MGSGACVIVCDVGAVREVVGDCGLYVPSSSPEELAIAIEKVLQDSVLRQRLQDTATERARSLFTFDKKVERLRAFLRLVGILDPGPPLLPRLLRGKASTVGNPGYEEISSFPK